MFTYIFCNNFKSSQRILKFHTAELEKSRSLKKKKTPKKYYPRRFLLTMKNTELIMMRRVFHLPTFRPPVNNANFKHRVVFFISLYIERRK